MRHCLLWLCRVLYEAKALALGVFLGAAIWLFSGSAWAHLGWEHRLGGWALGDGIKTSEFATVRATTSKRPSLGGIGLRVDVRLVASVQQRLEDLEMRMAELKERIRDLKREADFRNPVPVGSTVMIIAGSILAGAAVLFLVGYAVLVIVQAFGCLFVGIFTGGCTVSQLPAELWILLGSGFAVGGGLLAGGLVWRFSRNRRPDYQRYSERIRVLQRELRELRFRHRELRERGSLRHPQSNTRLSGQFALPNTTYSRIVSLSF